MDWLCGWTCGICHLVWLFNVGKTATTWSNEPLLFLFLKFSLEVHIKLISVLYHFSGEFGGAVAFITHFVNLHGFLGESISAGELPCQLDPGLDVCILWAMLIIYVISAWVWSLCYTSILYLQALFNSLPPEDYKNGLLVLGGDGRYFNKEAAQVSSRAFIFS